MYYIWKEFVSDISECLQNFTKWFLRQKGFLTKFTSSYIEATEPVIYSVLLATKLSWIGTEKSHDGNSHYFVCWAT